MGDEVLQQLIMEEMKLLYETEWKGNDRRICLHQTEPSPRDETLVLLH